jgi:hypothetical protein
MIGRIRPRVFDARIFTLISQASTRVTVIFREAEGQRNRGTGFSLARNNRLTTFALSRECKRESRSPESCHDLAYSRPHGKSFSMEGNETRVHEWSPLITENSILLELQLQARERHAEANSAGEKEINMGFPRNGGKTLLECRFSSRRRRRSSSRITSPRIGLRKAARSSNRRNKPG